jgi:hypothetical protein
MEYNTMCRVIFVLTEAVQQGDKAIVARLLNVPTSKVMERFRGSEPGICNDIPKEHRKSLRTDWVYTIIAIGSLSYQNGLVALGNKHDKFELKSGQSLHFLGDVPQLWSGKGGGTLLWLYWSNLPTF